ncbi:MAG: DUF4476 domain-containing protein [Bacteroidales bacterium]|nr:DUF4476 domain-containing protein [Bacteroidales bacterium]
MNRLLTFLLVSGLLSQSGNLLAQNRHHSSNPWFDRVMVSIESTQNSQYRYDRAMQYFSRERSTVAELTEACYYMKNDEARYQLCLEAYPLIIDKYNFFRIYDSFSKFSYAIMLYHHTQGAAANDHEQENYPDRSGHAGTQTSIELPSPYGYAGMTGANCEVPMHENDFRRYYSYLELDRDENRRFETLKEQVRTYCFTTAQIMQLALELQSEIRRLEFLKYAYSKCYDMENFMNSTQLLNSPRNRDDLHAFIAGQQMHSPTGHRPPANGCFVHPSEFSYMKKEIESESFSNDKAQVARNHIANNCLTAEQVRELVLLFDFENDRMDLIRFSYQYVQNPDKMYILRDALKFSSSKLEFDSMLREGKDQ